jgi:hypothetical protein
MSDLPSNEARQARLGHHGRSKSHFEQEVEVLERDLLDRLPSRHSGIHHHDGPDHLALGRPTDELPTGWTGHEEAKAFRSTSPQEGTVSPCHSSDRTVAAIQPGEGPLEPVDKPSKEEGTVTVGPTGGQGSWEDDGFLFTREGRTVWVSNQIF